MYLNMQQREEGGENEGGGEEDFALFALASEWANITLTCINGGRSHRETSSAREGRLDSGRISAFTPRRLFSGAEKGKCG